MTALPTKTDLPTVNGSHRAIGDSGFAVAELWRRYADGDERARENLILNFAPLVKVVAGRLGSRLPPHVAMGDLVGFGMTGLMGAIERYDPAREVRFETFAMTRIRGAMIDALRSLDWVPRRVRLDARAFEQAESRLGARLGRAPTEDELAEDLGLEVEGLRRRLLEIADSRIYSFDAPLPGREGGAPADSSLLDVVSDGDLANPQGGPDGGGEESDLRAMLADAISGLPERQQFVLACRYREDLRLREIGEVMGVSESRVSQLHTKALISLRAIIGADGRRDMRLAQWN